jgi:hypothetical protein
VLELPVRHAGDASRLRHSVKVLTMKSGYIDLEAQRARQSVESTYQQPMSAWTAGLLLLVCVGLLAGTVAAVKVAKAAGWLL